LKIAKQVQAMRGFPRRYKIISRRGSYHGMTHGAMSLTAMRNEAYFGPFMYGVSHVPHPNQYRSDFGLEGEAADIMAARYVEQEIENQGPETVADFERGGCPCPVGDLLEDAARDLRSPRRSPDRR
jgi:adenosylmethionine-8-amino-7-oxononanoate aminotransferase